jgi:histidyl-tRNA synthetase
MPLKLYYVGPFFRYEKPQAGRSREFYQFGIEMFGTSKASADATVISVAARVFKELGINTTLNINSIGCKECRPKYHDSLRDYFASHSDQLCDTCKERLKTNPLRILDCKSPVCSAIAKTAPKTIEHLCPECENHFEELKKALEIMGLEYKINPMIVRGLDYYVRTVFEFISDDIGAQSTVCGGGRYDGLVKELDGPELCGIGFGMGLTRLILAMKKNAENGKITLPENRKPDIYIAPMGSEAEFAALKLVDTMRDMGLYAETDITGRSLKAQMKYANKLHASYTLIIGDSEVESGKAQLRNMENGEQTEVSLDDFVI